jgi:hypothetical protein
MGIPSDSNWSDFALALPRVSNEEEEPEEIEPAHLPAALEGLAQVAGRQFVTDTEVEAAFCRFE